ncbi:hypothetical protein [Anatilimnocola floriformis]|uniref:hypothetical protein n=1 Tax=Anatilimnocola floriformis TaxID=2948575 RepID=UPI0020C52D52|nr:hypothetical protein [Anatilimnocola floriformis]
MILTGTSIAISLLSVGCAGLGAYTLGKWLFTKDTEIEARRRAAMQITGKLEGFGLKRLPRITGAYAIGDYSLLAHELKAFADILIGDATALMKEFDEVFTNVLRIKLQTPEGKALVAAKLADASVAA